MSKELRKALSILTKVLCLGLLVVGCTSVEVPATNNAAANLTAKVQPEAALHPKRANFEGESKSRDVQNMADWVVDSGDNGGTPFVIIDKVDARVFVFGADGRLRGAAPALLGLAKGDDTIPGIGNRKLSSIRPEERTTPAGRFVASLGHNFKGKDVLWVDYSDALSLHRVIPVKPRLASLDTPTPLDNRMSFGCINVPAKFYDTVVKPVFTGTRGIVYILPEVRSKKEIFASYYDIESRTKQSWVSTSEQK
ncbi:MAG: hypothetical protein H6Q52_2380 [Deltaproteobacteria bacterium]|nr:hypothetical protein [Deltaproteobacteria bacterium]